MNSFEWVLYYSMAYLNSIICNIFWFTPFSSVSTDTNSSTQTACTSPGFDMLQQELIFFQCHFGYFISFIFVYMQWFLLDIKSHFNFVVQARVSVWWTTLWASCCLILSLLPKGDCFTLPMWPLLVAQMAKNLPAMQETWVQPLGKIPWRREWLLNSRILEWRVPWTEELLGPLSMGSQRVGQDWETDTSFSPHASLTLELAYREPLCPILVSRNSNLHLSWQFLFSCKTSLVQGSA